ncbi:DNA-binding HxlR family transcriptional regulator [Rubricella aquisinus]|uniref:DNA-binding HxlR family transcriptional regulator n=1 Tax=Rubricella aquisinus TaxID=2028108 RepID=A0A840WYS9_9RHOB|nr:helix-turn-helix domain-containing protein [Rubricella aquisinus]MBB5515554.1 DNA-binding HxlR family transcriptional regulator [Rubricella aquisinus]
MSASDDKRPSGCPVTFGLDTFGDRWTLLIIREMLFRGKSTYGEFLAADEGISTNILANRMKQLEADGIVVKRRDPDNFRSFLYQLTPKGYDLAPILIEIIRWSGQYDERPTRLTEMFDRVQSDRKGLEQEIMARRSETRS